jgi:hypothetical protein
LPEIFDNARHRVNLFAQSDIYAGLTVFTQDYSILGTKMDIYGADGAHRVIHEVGDFTYVTLDAEPTSHGGPLDLYTP